MDFDLALKNIKELNTISGEGEHYIKHTKDGARLQVNNLCCKFSFLYSYLMGIKNVVRGFVLKNVAARNVDRNIYLSIKE